MTEIPLAIRSLGAQNDVRCFGDPAQDLVFSVIQMAAEVRLKLSSMMAATYGLSDFRGLQAATPIECQPACTARRPHT